MSFQVTSDQGAALRATLLNDSGKTPLHERFRALFMLKAVGGDEVVKIISQGLSDPSPLLKHELAYVLGQMSNPLAISTLESVLIDQNHQHTSMVRHEAAEALGALSSEGSLPLLRRYLKDPSREVRETCEVAIGKIEFDTTEEGKSRKTNTDFPTIDPAPSSAPEDVPALRRTLLDTKKPLFERYRAMFALRDFGAGSKDAITSLADGFIDDSALFRHEIAYIFGQLCSPYSIPSLLSRLRDPVEDDMVRHEAAEALGGIASDGVEPASSSSIITHLQTTKANKDLGERERKAQGLDELLPPGGVLEVLREWAVREDAPLVVKESCQIAIDMWEYENSPDQFNPLDSFSNHVEPKELPKGNLTGMERSAANAVAAGVQA